MGLVEGLVAVLISLENPRWLFALIDLNFQETVFFFNKIAISWLKKSGEKHTSENSR